MGNSKKIFRRKGAPISYLLYYYLCLYLFVDTLFRKFFTSKNYEMKIGHR